MVSYQIKHIGGKILKYLGIFIGILLVILLVCWLRFKPAKNPVWGINFSYPFAQYLGLDWKKVYGDMLTDLHPKTVRLMAYWEQMEPRQGEWKFDDLDYLITESQKNGVDVVLVVGHKQPRWPECHQPDWYNKLSDDQKHDALNTMMAAAVNHFKQFKNISAWQVENEPMFNYGPDCKPLTREQLQQEILLVKNIDRRPIIVTDSGEKGWWIPSAWAGADILGPTMYREAYYEKQGKYVKYPLPPLYYQIRAGMVSWLSKTHVFWGMELQTEPWFISTVYDMPWSEQEQLMNPQKFKDNIEYARKAGFERNYLWGVEWWYWAKTQGHPQMWQAAKELFNNVQ